MPALVRVNSRAHSEIVDTLQAEGAVIVEGLLDDGLLARFNAELDPLLERASLDQRFVNSDIAAFFGRTTRHLSGVAAKSRIYAEEILTHPVYRAACDAVLLPSCAQYQLNLAHVLDRGPGSERQLLHRDQDIWKHFPQPHPELMLASVIALVDFTAELGATVVAPGSHGWDPEREPAEEDLVPAEMPAGSAVLYLGSTIHAAGTNQTEDRWRRGMHMSYCLGWLRTEENSYLATPPHVARELPRESLELLGYAAHDAIAVGGGYLGTVELQSPIDLLDTLWS